MRIGVIGKALAVAVLAALLPFSAEARIALDPVVTSELQAPDFATHAGDGSGRLFILEQPGRIRIATASGLVTQPFLDITGKVLSDGERGLLGLAFHPKYATNGRFFVNYTRRPDGATVIGEYRVSSNRNVALQSERVILTIPQPYANHNGGMLAFSPGGYLFIGMGDGGSGGDPQNRAQNPQELLGKILRLNVNTTSKPYGIPSTNPFASGVGGRPEIYALGFRNPWRFSFERGTNTLYVGDVGQKTVEEVDRVVLGGNYGWRIMEGDRCYNPSSGCNRTGLKLPILTYTHAGGRCSVTGGYVYRGAAVPELIGTYLYADFCTGEIFGWRNGQSTLLLDTELSITSFGEDQAGELLVVGLGGTVHRIVTAP